MDYNEIKGDLISLALKGHFDVITHGCNCQNNMGAGIAPQMVKAFGCNSYPFNLESSPLKKGDINKLGCIEACMFEISKDGNVFTPLRGRGYTSETPDRLFDLWVVNSYTQFNYGRNHADGDKKPLDYEALTLCMRKINRTFQGKHIGLPKIGAGLAGGDWNKIKEIIQRELKDCKVTVVIYEKVL